MKSFKLTNKKRMSFQIRILVFLIICNVLALLFLFFVKPHLSYAFVLKVVFLTAALFLMVMFYRAKYFEYDYSGEVISIRSYHPVFTKLERRTEFPKYKLDDFKVTRKQESVLLRLSLKLFENRSIRVNYKVYGLSDSGVRDLKHSLESTKEHYNPT